MRPRTQSPEAKSDDAAAAQPYHLATMKLDTEQAAAASKVARAIFATHGPTVLAPELGAAALQVAAACAGLANVDSVSFVELAEWSFDHAAKGITQLHKTEGDESAFRAALELALEVHPGAEEGNGANRGG